MLVSTAQGTKFESATANAELPIVLALESASVDLVFALEVDTERSDVPFLGLELSGALTGCQGGAPDGQWSLGAFDGRVPAWSASDVPTSVHWSPGELETAERRWTVPVRLVVEGGATGCVFEGVAIANVLRPSNFLHPLEEDLGVSLRWVSAGGTAP